MSELDGAVDNVLSLVDVSAKLNDIFQQGRQEMSKRFGKKYCRPILRLLRQRLLRTIEAAIGREVHNRWHTTYINVLEADFLPPNCYKWRFTDNYEAFPEKGLSKWNFDEMKQCNEALEKNWLWVINAAGNLIDDEDGLDEIIVEQGVDVDRSHLRRY